MFNFLHQCEQLIATGPKGAVANGDLPGAISSLLLALILIPTTSGVALIV